MANDVPKERLNIYLMKDGVTPEQIISADAEQLVRITLKPELVFQGAIYFKTSGSHPPAWFKFVQSGTDEVLPLSVRSAASLVTLVHDGRAFAIAFGSSRHWIDESQIERRFGMIVTLNCVHPDHIRSLDREEFDTITRTTRSQTSVSAPIENFGLDVQRDLVRSVTGTPENLAFATHVTGADNLIINATVTFDGLGTKCGEAFAIFQQTAYRDRYPWIDNFIRVRDPLMVETLDKVLEDRLNDAAPVDIFLAPPSLLDTQEHRGYRYPRQRGGLHEDLRLADYLAKAVIPEKNGVPASRLTIAEIKKSKIRHYTADEKTPGDTFSVYDSVVFETIRDGKLFTLTRGEWFQIDQHYVTEVDNEVKSIEDHPALILPGANDNELEGDYNARAAASSGGHLLLMDKKLVMYGGGRSKMEVCDLLSASRDFIHVKAKTKSAALSHLFAQGLNSAQAFRDKSFRLKALEHCPDTHRAIFEAENILPSEHSVVYGVMTTAPNELHEALPFFSRQSLANASRELKNMGYKVHLRKISVAEAPAA
jgi:uncharacterized protein (TIGR04141 family)